MCNAHRVNVYGIPTFWQDVCCVLFFLTYKLIARKMKIKEASYLVCLSHRQLLEWLACVLLESTTKSVVGGQELFFRMFLCSLLSANENRREATLDTHTLLDLLLHSKVGLVVVLSIAPRASAHGRPAFHPSDILIP